MENVIIIGSLKYSLDVSKNDDVVTSSKIRYASSSILVSTSLRFFDLKPVLISAIGNDVLGDGILNYLKKNKLETSSLIVDKTKPTAYILKVNNEKIIDTSDISSKITLDNMSKLEPFIAKSNGIILTSEVDITILEEVKRIATKYGVYIGFIYNIEQELSKKFYTYLDVIFVSEQIAKLDDSKDSMYKKTLNKFYKLGVQKTIIVNGLGPIYYKDALQMIKVNMYKEYIKGFNNLAFHSFCAKFYNCMLKKTNVLEALSLSQAQAALIVSKKGFVSDIDCDMLVNSEILKVTNI